MHNIWVWSSLAFAFHEVVFSLISFRNLSSWFCSHRFCLETIWQSGFSSPLSFPLLPSEKSTFCTLSSNFQTVPSLIMVYYFHFEFYCLFLSRFALQMCLLILVLFFIWAVSSCSSESLSDMAECFFYEEFRLSYLPSLKLWLDGSCFRIDLADLV